MQPPPRSRPRLGSGAPAPLALLLLLLAAAAAQTHPRPTGWQVQAPTAHADNDVTPTPAHVHRPLAHVEEREEASNRIADAAPNSTPAPPSTPIYPPSTPIYPPSTANPTSPSTPSDPSISNFTSPPTASAPSTPIPTAPPSPSTPTNAPREEPPSLPPLFSNGTWGEGEQWEEEEEHPCARECVEGAKPMRCHYTFHVAGYASMSKACHACPLRASDCARPHCVPGDGSARGLVVVNRRMPGPAIEVCVGDRVVVDVHNGLHAQTTSVHWHGLQQRGTPYSDGVPHVTQCPIAPLTTFRYSFRADAPGTHFWHSHSGQQRADGAFGALVVRRPRVADPHAPLYDRDERAHLLVLADWGEASGEERFLQHHHAGGTNKPSALLINGRARVNPARAGAFPPVPAPEFRVRRGLRYRFRLVNAGFLNCPVELSVDGHGLLVVAGDGNDVAPVAAQSLVSYAGERWDFVLEANASADAYWVRARGLLDCDERFGAVHQVAVLRYEGDVAPREPNASLSYEAARRPGHQVNALNVGTGTEGATTAAELRALAEDDLSLQAEPDLRFYLPYDFYAVDNPHFHAAPHYAFNAVGEGPLRVYTPQFSHISMRLPAAPMLPQRQQLDEAALCNASSLAAAGRRCERSYCECAHVLRVPLGAVVELVLVDEGAVYEANHPFHLHGHAFRVVAMRRLGNRTTLEEVQRLDAQGLIPRNLRRAPLKDTCTVPDGGLTVLRFRADNPGYWLFHCHIEFHVEVGMALVVKVGEHHHFPPVPSGFPSCGDWMPEDEVEEEQRRGREEHRTERAAPSSPPPPSSTTACPLHLPLPLLLLLLLTPAAL